MHFDTAAGGAFWPAQMPTWCQHLDLQTFIDTLFGPVQNGHGAIVRRGPKSIGDDQHSCHGSGIASGQQILWLQGHQAWKISVQVTIVEAVANDKLIGNLKGDKVRLQLDASASVCLSQ